MSTHLALPLRVSATRSLAAHAAGSPTEIAQSVGLLLATRVGERRSEPAYGSADSLFAPRQATGPGQVDTGAVSRWEPRATASIIDITVATS